MIEKDPEKCHYWLNQVRVACMESGRNLCQSLIFCAKDAVLAVLSGLNPGLTDEQVKEELIRCFSPAPTRKQAIEKLRAMYQEPHEQMHQYIVRHEVAHLRAHRLTADEQCNTSEIIEFAINLQPLIQGKLLIKINGNRPPRSLREAYDQALDLECKNQITIRYEMSTQAHQIAECSLEEEHKGVEVVELRPHGENTGPTLNKNNRVQRNFNQSGSGNFRERQNDGYNHRPTFENSNRGTRRGTNRNFHSQHQEDTKSTKWDAQFQAYGIDGGAVLEALKKLTAYTILQGNRPETDYLRHLAQYNPNLKEKLCVRQDTPRQAQKEDKATVKEIAEAFSAMTGQEICGEEVSLIQGIQLPEEEEFNLTEDTEASEGDVSNK